MEIDILNKKNKQKKKDILLSQEEVEAQAAEIAWMQDSGAK
jgi:hypothetical protein